MKCIRTGRHQRGFTLIEVLVALLIMAILAGMAWQGLDSIVRAREGGNAVLDRTLRLNNVISQWEQDLQAVEDTGVVPALSFDGQSLRLTRRTEGGVALVVWAVRGGSWQRWTTPAAIKVAELRENWLRSQQLLGNEAGQLTVAQASDWQVYFYRGNAWTNPQSTGNLVAQPSAAAAAPPPVQSPGGGGQAPPPAPPLGTAVVLREQLPAAVRLVINLGTGTGSLTRDVALGPAGG